jgi:transposase
MDTNVVRKTIREHVDFSGKAIYLGLDVHKRKWSVSVYVGEFFYQTFQQDSIAVNLLNYLQGHFPGGDYIACYEAGFCGFSIYRELVSLGIDCLVVNPTDVPQTGKGRVVKSDTSDSKRLGLALSRGMLQGIYVPDRSTESDRKLLRYRQRLQQMLCGHRKSLKSTLQTVGIKIPEQYDKHYWTKNFVHWVSSLDIREPSLKVTLELIVGDVAYLRGRLLCTNKKIRAMSGEKRYAGCYAVLVSVPGIGPITAMTLLTEVGDIRRFESFSRFNSFIGLCPSEFSSGEREHKGKMTQRKHARLRQLIIEAAWVSIRVDPAMALKFQELSAVKTKKRSIVVIARKLLSRIYNIWMKNLFYEKGVIK